MIVGPGKWILDILESQEVAKPKAWHEYRFGQFQAFGGVDVVSLSLEDTCIAQPQNYSRPQYVAEAHGCQQFSEAKALEQGWNLNGQTRSYPSFLDSRTANRNGKQAAGNHRNSHAQRPLRGLRAGHS
jgi:hypothetical protein